MRLVFATNNKHKLEEIRKIIPASIEIISLKDIGCEDDLPETGTTLEQNAYQKAHYIFDKYGLPCFADDSGLETDALGGHPGVYSARYADSNGGHADAENIKKVLVEMNHEENRKARFRTVISLITATDTGTFFDGSVNGQLTTQPRGSSGFGYDPIFIPDGYHITFAEMLPEMKNRISHRAEAVKKLAEFLLLNNE
jgi:XTP/dITP diphosphohydrolase